jgi:tryptophanase
MSITKIVLGLSLLFSTYSYADDEPRTKEYLHSYGIAYCLSKTERYKEEASIAMGGYFQIGDHSIQAQNQVRKYIDQQIQKSLDGYQGSHLSAYLMRCLEISYSKEYREQVDYVLDHFKE